MKKFLNLAAAHPWPVLGVLLLVSLAAASQVHRLQIHVSPQGLTLDGDPAKEFYERSVATFGSDNITLVFIRDQDLFDYHKLEAIRSAIVPVLLVIIGSTEDIHLISEYYDGTIAGYGRQQAIRYMARRMGLAVLLTFFTSYLGFLAIAANPIQLLREFGLVASTGLAFNFLITSSLLPVYLRFLGDRHPVANKGRKRVVRDRMIEAVSHLVLNRKKWIVLFTLSAVAVAAYGALSIRINNNILDYLDDGSPVKQRALVLHEKLSGMETFSIILDGDFEGTFQRARYLGEIVEIQRYLDASPAFDFSISFADYLALLNSVVNESGEPELPGDDEVLNELTLLRIGDRRSGDN